MPKSRRIRLDPKRLSQSRPLNSSVRHLILIDVEPLLRTERERCEKAARKLDAAKDQLAHFREACEPAFSRWFHSQYCERVSAVRELEVKYHRLDDLMTAVEREVFLTGCSPRSAYQRLEQKRREWEQAQEEMQEKFEERMKRQPGEEPRADADRDPESTADQQKYEDREEEMPPEMEAMLRVMFETAFGDEDQLGKKRYDALFEDFKQSFKEDVLGQERDSQGDSGSRHGKKQRSHRSRHDERHAENDDHPDAGQKENPESSRLKQLYRQLARRLHPDHNRELTTREKELWHEAQAAYDAHDLDRLETLLAMTESVGGEIGFRGIMSVSRLRALVQDFGRKLRATQKALREAKKSPSWDFVTVERDPVKFALLACRIEEELTEATRELSSEVEDMEAQIEEWSNPRRGQKKRRSSPSRWDESSRPSRERHTRSRGRKGSPGMTKAEMDAFTGFGKRS